MKDDDDCAAELRLIVARRQVNVAEPRLIATGSLVNAAELLCCNENDDCAAELQAISY